MGAVEIPADEAPPRRRSWRRRLVYGVGSLLCLVILAVGVTVIAIRWRASILIREELGRLGYAGEIYLVDWQVCWDEWNVQLSYRFDELPGERMFLAVDTWWPDSEERLAIWHGGSPIRYVFWQRGVDEEEGPESIGKTWSMDDLLVAWGIKESTIPSPKGYELLVRARRALIDLGITPPCGVENWHSPPRNHVGFNPAVPLSSLRSVRPDTRYGIRYVELQADETLLFHLEIAIDGAVRPVLKKVTSDELRQLLADGGSVKP